MNTIMLAVKLLELYFGRIKKQTRKIYTKQNFNLVENLQVME